MYHPSLLDHFRNPRNAGELDDASAAVEVSNPGCGDVMKLSIRVQDGAIAAARFKCQGCVAAIACGSALTELLLGNDLAVAGAVTADQIEQAVGGLPRASKHAAELAAEAAQAAVRRATGRSE